MSIRYKLLFASAAALMPSWLSAGTSIAFSSGTSLLSSTGYTPNGTPNNTDDVNLTAASGTLAIAGGALTVESLSMTSTTGSYTFSNNTTAPTNSTLTLGNSSGFTNIISGVANDLIDENSTKNLTINGVNGSTGSGTLGIILASSGNFDLANSKAGLTIASNISEATAGTSVTITGLGTGTFSGTNTFSGGLVTAGGELDVSADVNLGASGGSITVNGGRLGFATNSFTISSSRPFYLGANPTGSNTSGTVSTKGTVTITYNGNIQNMSGITGDLVKQGGGTLSLGGTSTYSGTTFINNGVLQLTANNNINPSTTFNIGQSGSANTGTFDLDGTTQSIAGLNSVTGSTNTTVNTVMTSAGTGALAIDGSGNYSYGSSTATNSGVITGNLSLNVSLTGSGSQALGGPNTYTQGTQISSGILQANAPILSTTSSSTGTGSVVLLGGTLEGTGGVMGAVTVNSGSSIVAGIGAGNASLTIGSGTIKGTAKFALDSDTGKNDELISPGAISLGASSLLNVTDLGSTALTSGTFVLINAAGGVNGTFSNFADNSTCVVGANSYTVSYDTSDEVALTIASTPEPASLTLLALSTSTLLLRRRRRDTTPTNA